MSAPPIISNHRLARLALWLLALVAWFACGGIGERHRRRYGELSLAKIERAARNIIIIRAAQLLAPRKPRPRRYGVKPVRASLRAVAGVWLRRRLRTKGDLIARARHLLTAFRNWRAIAAELALRRRRGLTRLAPILRAPKLSAPMRAFAILTPRAADTS